MEKADEAIPNIKKDKIEEELIHHTEEEVVDRLFAPPTVEIPSQVKNIWGWASGIAKDTIEKVKVSSNDIIEEATKKLEETTKKLEETKLFSEKKTDVKEENIKNLILPWDTKATYTKELEERILDLTNNSSTFEEIPKGVSFKLPNDWLETSKSLLKFDERLLTAQTSTKLTKNQFWLRYLYQVNLICDSYSKKDDTTDDEIGSWEDELAKEIDLNSVTNSLTDDFEMFDDDELIANIDVDNNSDDELEKRLDEKFQS